MITRRHIPPFLIRFLFVTALLALQVPLAPASAAAQRSRTTAGAKSVTSAPSGFYFEVSPCPRCYRCRPCTLNAGWQQRMMRLLGANGISSFPGEASGLEKVKEEFGSVSSIKRFARAPGYDTMVYVGPFDTEKSALEAIAELCAVLGEVGIVESSCDDMTAKRDGNSLYTRGSFDVSAVRLSAKAASN